MTTAHRENGLLSPAQSDISVAYAPSDVLPVPRSHPLPAGSSKQIALINYLDDRILHITSRYAKSFAASATDRDHNVGYTNLGQVITDVDAVLDVVWISNTPSIQIPYLLSLAGHFRDYLHSFTFVTDSFRLARKFDLAFSRLLSAQDHLSTAITMTDKVRIRSLAQETRVEMTEVASKSGMSVDEDASSDDEDFDDDDTSDGDRNLNNQSIAMSLGRVYEKTLEILGADLSSLPALEPQREDTPNQASQDVEIIDL